MLFELPLIKLEAVVKKVAVNLVLTVANSVNCFRHRSVGESGKGGEADG